MKIISMYLPQFHKVPENDQWWGEGFTDWVSTKKGKPFFDGHYQPHEPLNENYYNLLEKKTMIWQADLMHQYGIDGQCFYHYWFKDGKKILEKPAENLLAWKDIDMPFCFCWANETWARSWSGLRFTNAWSDNNEPARRDGEKAILLEQNYGDKEAWKQHFDYLLSFFKDKRYIKQDGKPVFLIYRSSDIYCLEDMADYFNECAKANGFNGIYFICANVAGKLPVCIDAALIHEPQNSYLRLNREKFDNGVLTVDYEVCWKELLSSRRLDRKTYYEGFTGYDDTPRRGIKGTVVTGASPELFGKYLSMLMARSESEGNDMVFINAWNEWGEGMHLEPDERFDFGYLEKIPEAKARYKDISLERNFMNPDMLDELDKIQSRCDKFERYLNLLDEWVTVRENGIQLKHFFVTHKLKHIAIYGYNLFAKHLIHDLRDTDIQIVCLIDKQKNKIPMNMIPKEIPIMLPEDRLPDIDALVVAAFYHLSDIKNFYRGRTVKIISIENVIKEVEI